MEKETGKEKVRPIAGRCFAKIVIFLSLFSVACTSRVVYIGPDEYVRMAEALRRCHDERSQCEQDLSDCISHADDLLLNCN